MTARNTLLALALASGWTAATLWVTAPAFAQLPDDLRAGIRVEAEGQRLDDRTFTAEEVEIQARRTGKDEVAGPITAVEVGKGRLRIHAAEIRLNADAEVEDDDGKQLELSDFEEGLYAEAEGVFRNGVLHAEELKLVVPDPGEELKVELSGIVTKTNPSGSSFETLGIEVLVTPRTTIEMK